MVFCTYCGQSFTRDEHLERHILTHTNVKPFKCFTCHMSFARRDLLQRHYTVHGRDQNNQEGLPINNGMIPKSAGRTPIACSNCAKTKTKCDKKFPCSRCAGRNLRCTLRPTRRSSKNVNRVPAPGEGATVVAPDSANITPNASNGNSPQPQPESAALQNPTPPEEKVLADASFFEQSPPMSNAPLVSGALATTLPTTMSPLPTPGTVSGFVQSTPLGGYDDFMRSVREGSDQASSPRFMMDWAQMQIPTGFDPMGRPDLMIAAEMGLDMNGMPTSSHGDGMLTMIPELSQALPPVSTPMTTPRIEGAFSDLDLGSSGNMFFSHTRTASVSDSGVTDLGAVVAAQDAWSAFRCTPTIPSSSCPKTARLNLEKLEQSLKNHEGWSKWNPNWEDADFAGPEPLAIQPLQENSRDKLLAITQSFLHKALDIHKDGSLSSPNGGASPNPSSTNFVLLPPARVLESFLKSFACSFERFFPLTSRGKLDANELLECYDDKASSLLVLLMISQGAMMIPSLDARWLNGGLTEACRISLFDLIEKNVTMASDGIVLHSALLFIAQAGWSGDKWQMDIAMGQRGMYTAMMRHSGALEPRPAPTARAGSTPDGLWSDWIQQETRSRLVYSWAMVDQDLALFRDIAPLFSVTEFGAPMPDADRLWHAKSATEWSSVFEQVHQISGGYSSVGSGARPLSLRDMFSLFLDDEILSQGIELTPLHLRLLLHPLQSLVCQFCQLLSCFSDTMGSRQRVLALSAASTRVRMEEVQTLLQRWYDLADRYIKSNPMCPMMQASLVIFHLISLNAVTNFAEIERLARRENFDGTYQQLVWVHKRCITDVEEAIFHCGQVLRLIRSMPKGVRPPWWAAAIYRVSLILWTDSLTHNESITPSSGLFPVPGPSFAVDSLPPDHPLIVRYLTKREGLPTLTKRDGSQIPLDHAFTVLSHCIDVIDEGNATRFSDGIRGKLERLARG